MPYAPPPLCGGEISSRFPLFISIQVKKNVESNAPLIYLDLIHNLPTLNALKVSRTPVLLCGRCTTSVVDVFVRMQQHRFRCERAILKHLLEHKSRDTGTDQGQKYRHVRSSYVGQLPLTRKALVSFRVNLLWYVAKTLGTKCSPVGYINPTENTTR